MALKDCLRKMEKAGVPVSDADTKLLETFIDQGMTDDEAVRRLIVQTDKKIVDIASRAVEEGGAKVVEQKDVLGEVRAFATALQNKQREALAAIQKETNELQIQQQDINFAEGIVKHWEHGGPSIDIYDDQQLQTRLSQMFFHEATGPLLRNGNLVSGIFKGSDPIKLYDSFKLMQSRSHEIRMRLLALVLEEAMLLQAMGEQRPGGDFALDNKGDYTLPPETPDSVKEDPPTYGALPWKLTRSPTAEGDLYISRIGPNAGTPHRTRQGPNDFAITFDDKVLLADYGYYLLQYLQPEIAARAHGTAQQAIRKADIEEVMVNHFQRQAKEPPPDPGDIYANRSVPAAQRVEEAQANYKATVKVEKERDLNVGITKVTNAAEAAHVLAHIRRNPSEGFWALVLDVDDNVVGIVEHSRGTFDGTSVYPSTYAGAIMTIPGAAKVWMAHNHPSGVLTTSQADQRITRRVSLLMDGSGVEVMGHVLMGSGQKTFTSIDNRGDTISEGNEIFAAPRNKRVSVFTRTIRRHVQGEAIRSPADTRAVLTRMGNPNGVLLMNNRHEVLGFMSMTPDEMNVLKGTGQSGRLLRAFAEMNAAAFIVTLDAPHAVAANNMMGFASVGDVRMLDAMYKTPQGVMSMAERGELASSSTFYQSVIGFTSGLLTAARTMPQKRGPVKEMLAALKSRPGVTARRTEQQREDFEGEWEWLGVEEYFTAKGGIVTRDELIAYIASNGITVEETRYGAGQRTEVPNFIDTEVTDPDRAAELGIDPEDFRTGAVGITDVTSTNTLGVYTVVFDQNAGNVRVIDELAGEDLAVPGAIGNQDSTHAFDAMYENEMAVQRGKEFEGPASYGEGSPQVMEGGTGHREIVLRVPRIGNVGQVKMTGRLVTSWGGSMTDALADDLITDMPRAPDTLGDVDVARITADDGSVTMEFSNLSPEDFQNFETEANRLGAVIEGIADNVDALKAEGHTATTTRQIEDYEGGHWGIPNVVGWTRVNDRVGPNGEKILHVEEIQSDWHQRGLKYGYRQPLPEIPKYDLAESDGVWYAVTKEFEDLVYGPTQTDQIKVGRDVVSSKAEARLFIDRLLADRRAEYLAAQVDKVPSGPFKGNAWVSLVLKRIIRLAAEGGYDQITWTGGETQVLRNNLEGKAAAGALNFYDSTLPNLLRKAAKKLDKASAVTLQGQKIQVTDGAPFEHRLMRNSSLGGLASGSVGWYLVDRTGRQVSGPYDNEDSARGLAEAKNNAVKTVHVIDVTEQMKATALEGQTLYQKKRGSITFNETRQGLIRLFAARNLTTFLHESGHLYLEILAGLAERDNAPQQIKDDWAKVMEFLGVSNRAEITREHHEKWAESWEKYLEEGNAPSLALQDAFNAFRRWMQDIWNRMKQSPQSIELSEDIRGVMDRILASDAEIAQARASQELVSLWNTAESMGVSQEVFEVYQRNLMRANNDEVEKQVRAAMKAAQRQSQVWWADERSKIEFDVRTEAEQMPVYRALAFLQRGTNPDGTPTDRATFKLSRDDLIARYGKDYLKRLPKPWVYAVKNGVDADVAAGILGFETGNDLIEALIRAPKMEDWIQIETEARMQAQFPDPAVDGTLAENAVRVVHNEKRALILAAEMRQLRVLMRRDQKIVSATKRAGKREARQARAANKGTLPKREEMAIIRGAAKQTVANKRVRDLQPHVYLNAERRAGRMAFDAAARGDYQTAYIEKRRQIVNHEMYRAAVKAKEGSLKIQRYLSKFSNPRVAQRLAKLGVMDQISAVLEALDLKKVSLKELDRRAALQTLAEDIHSGAVVVDPSVSKEMYTVRVNKEGNEVVVLNEEFGVNWQDLTVNELAGYRDIVKQLEKSADRQLKMEVNGEIVVLEDAVNEIVESLYDAHETKDIGVGEKTPAERRGSALDNGIATLMGPSVLARLLDAKGWGAINRLMIVTIRRAYSERIIPMTQQAMEDMTDLWTKHYTNAERRKISKKDFAQVNGKWLSRSDVISIGMHMGNEGNKQALFNGIRADDKVAYPEGDVEAALAKLTSTDWEFVQEVWDYLESYWPALAKTQMERRGIVAEKVEATPFTVKTADGKVINMKGGYFPLSYDAEHSDRVKSDIFDDHYKNMGNGIMVSANTRAGATHNRVKNHRLVVQLGMFQIDKHLKEIIRDIAIGNEVNFVKNLINDKAVRTAFRLTGNMAALNQLNLWLTDAAVGEMPANNIPERMMAYIRVGFTKSKLAFNIYTTALQLTGAFQSAVTIGSKYMAIGIGRLMAHPIKNYKLAMESSSFLQVRYGKTLAFDKDVNDTARFLQNHFGGIPTTVKINWDKFGRMMFWPIAKMQSVVDVATWMGAYAKGLEVEKIDTHAEAVLYADSEVELAQTSGFFSDRSGLERGTLSATTRQQQFVRLWTTLLSYMLRKGNIAYLKSKQFQRDKSFKNATFLAMDMLMLYTVEGLAAAWIYGNWPDEDDEEGLLQFTAEQTALSVLSGIPFARETGTAIFGSGNTPLGGLTNDLADLYIQAMQGEPDKAAREAFVKSFGTMFHLPASQTNRLLEALLDEDDPEIWEYFTGTRD